MGKPRTIEILPRIKQRHWDVKKQELDIQQQELAIKQQQLELEKQTIELQEKKDMLEKQRILNLATQLYENAQGLEIKKDDINNVITLDNYLHKK